MSDLTYNVDSIDICVNGKVERYVKERTGQWISDWNKKIKMIDGCPDGSCHCSNCGEWLVASDEYAVKGIYCPNCGARMVSEDDT